MKTQDSMGYKGAEEHGHTHLVGETKNVKDPFLKLVVFELNPKSWD